MPTLKAEFERMAQVVGSRAGMPSGQEIDLPLGEHVYTAPSDGYMCVFAGMNDSASQTFLLGTSGGLNLSHWCPRRATIGVAAPIAKGQTSDYSVPSGSASKVFFLKTLGVLRGGLKRLIKKAFCLGGCYGFA